MNPWHFLDELVDLILVSEPVELGERTLRAVAGWSGGNRAAIFERLQDRVRLFASRAVDQHVLDLAEFLWMTRRSEFQAGRLFRPPRNGAERHTAAVFAATGAFVVQPLLDGPQVVGLLYVEGSEGRFASADDQHVLGQFARVATDALTRRRRGPGMAHDYLEQTPLKDMAREQLLVLLERNEWNISRVARLLQVTRPTVYSRLERYGIERRHVPKSVKRRLA